MYISSSVGAGGVNKSGDVKFVQELLSVLASEDMRLDILTVDGDCGKKTKEAIGKYQLHVVKLKTPDQRIDPNGRSEKTLVGKVNDMDKSKVAATAKKYGLAQVSVAAVGPKQIVYRANAKKVLSSYTENVVKLAMSYASIKRCDISSTIRTFDDQTRIMYNNCSSFPNATSVDTLKSARGWGYAAAGRAVEAEYFKNKSEGKEKCMAAMKKKIESLYKEGKKVSLHCVSESDYKKKNVLDIPYSSVEGGKRKAFETALMGMSKETKNARYAKPIPGEIYIDRLIIEDKCWHMEIPQTGKTIINKNAVSSVRKSGASTQSLKPYVGEMITLEDFLKSIVTCFDKWR